MIKDIPLADIDAKKLFTALKEKCQQVKDELKYMKEEQDDLICDQMNEWMQNNSNIYKQILDL